MAGLQICLDTLSTFCNLMWALIARSKVGPGVQLNIEISASSCSYGWVVPTFYLDRLPVDCSREEVGCHTVGYEVLGGKVG